MVTAKNEKQFQIVLERNMLSDQIYKAEDDIT
jgi:hypothetical protein